MSDALAAAAWLGAREPLPPPDLMRRMVRALEAVPAPSALWNHMAEASLLCLAEALALGDTREAALPLLAGDALLTSAFEAAAEFEPAAVATLIERFGARRLGALLPDDGA